MTTSMVSEALVEKILFLFLRDAPFPATSIYWEIQDDFQSLFISISVDELPPNQLAAGIHCVRQILDREMPVRDKDYSWVVGFTRGGEVVDGYFGGSRSALTWRVQ